MEFHSRVPVNQLLICPSFVRRFKRKSTTTTPRPKAPRTLSTTSTPALVNTAASVFFLFPPPCRHRRTVVLSFFLRDQRPKHPHHHCERPQQSPGPPTHPRVHTHASHAHTSYAKFPPRVFPAAHQSCLSVQISFAKELKLCFPNAQVPLITLRKRLLLALT